MLAVEVAQLRDTLLHQLLDGAVWLAEVQGTLVHAALAAIHGRTVRSLLGHRATLAMSELHANDVMHGDLSMASFLVAKDNVLRISVFGCSACAAQRGPRGAPGIWLEAEVAEPHPAAQHRRAKLVPGIFTRAALLAAHTSRCRASASGTLRFNPLLRATPLLLRFPPAAEGAPAGVARGVTWLVADARRTTKYSACSAPAALVAAGACASACPSGSST